MTQPYDEYDDTDQYTDDDQGSTVTLSRQQIRAMERDAKQARQAQGEADQLRRELAFARAGGNFTERQQKAVLATLDGDVTADSIRLAAEELGFLQAQPDPDGDNAAADRIAAASAGSSSEAGEDAVARLHQADREGGKDAVLAELQRQGRTIVTAG